MNTMHQVRYRDPITGKRRELVRHSVYEVMVYLSSLVDQKLGHVHMRVVLDTRGGDTLYEHDRIGLDGPVSLILRQLEEPWKNMYRLRRTW